MDGEKCPEGPRWTDPSFSGYGDFPLEVRFLLSSDKLEFEIQNGGLPQFLWNTFYHWRWIMSDCERGYEMIGAHAQKLAIAEFWILCEAHEPDCRTYIVKCFSTKNFEKFNDWMASANTSFRSEKEKLFYSRADRQGLKEAWYAANETRLMKLMR